MTVARQQIPVLQEGSAPAWGTIDIADEERAGRLVALGRALSDPGQDVRDARRGTRVLRAA